MATDGWIHFESYEGRIDKSYDGSYRSSGLRYPFIERDRTWDIVRVDGEPLDDLFRKGQFTVLSRGYDMMRKAHEDAAAYRLHFKRCRGVGRCADIGHPGGPRRSQAQALTMGSEDAPRATAKGVPTTSRRHRVNPAPERRLVPSAASEWTTSLMPVRAVEVRSVAPSLDLAVIPLQFDAWEGPALGLRRDCNKRGGRVIGDEGELSCAEVEIVKRLRRTGWEAAWVQAFKCGRDTWSAYIRDVPNFPDVVRRIQAVAGSGGGHPDVLAWKGDRVVAIESKGPGDRLKPSQIEWFERARHAGVAPGDLGVVEWRARG